MAFKVCKCDGRDVACAACGGTGYVHYDPLKGDDLRALAKDCGAFAKEKVKPVMRRANHGRRKVTRRRRNAQQGDAVNHISPQYT